MPVTPGEYAERPDHKHQGKYKVVNTVTGEVHGQNMTKEAAGHQKQLLYAVAHGWKPTEDK